MFVLLPGVSVLISQTGNGVQAQTAPRFRYGPDWPKALPNKGKMGGVTGLAVDKDDNVWVYDRPNDLTDIELEMHLFLASASAFLERASWRSMSCWTARGLERMSAAGNHPGG